VCCDVVKEGDGFRLTISRFVFCIDWTTPKKEGTDLDFEGGLDAPCALTIFRVIDTCLNSPVVLSRQSGIYTPEVVN
jgi:hypothetical protein